MEGTEKERVMFRLYCIINFSIDVIITESTTLMHITYHDVVTQWTLFIVLCMAAIGI